MKRIYFKVFCLFVLLLMVVPVFAQVKINSETVQEWSDDFFTQSLEEKRLSGAVITVVKDNKIIFSNGYGYADYAAKTLIDPDATVFMIGSITKTFTATAFAQLLDRGLIDSLDDPANKYLKRDTLPNVDGKEITLKQLITHTAGFGNITFHLSNDGDVEYPLSAKEITSRRPPIVRHPGGRPVYSNYSTTMIGVIMEDITGQSLDKYFKDNIFTPLGMTNSELNMSSHPSKNQAVPYGFYPNGTAGVIPYYNIHPFFSAVGAVTSTGEDMAKYMMAQLEEGSGTGSPLKISPETFNLLHGRLVGNHSETQGFGMVFMVDDWAGERTYGHGGDYPGFHSIMWMLPERNTAIFISLLAEGPDSSFIEGMFGSERMTPNTDSPVEAPLTNVGSIAEFLIHFIGPDYAAKDNERLDVDDLVGSYRHEYRAYGTMEEILDMFSGYEAVATVEKLGENEILINGELSYTQVAKGVFWNSELESYRSGQFGDSALMVFSRDSDEERYFVTPRFTVDPFVQVGTFDNPQFYNQLLIIGLLLSLSGLLALAWKSSTRLSEKYAKRIAVFLPFLIISIPLSLLIGYPEGESVSTHLLLGNSSHYIVAAVLSNLLLVLTLVQIFFTYKAWRTRFWGKGLRAFLSRIHISLVAFGGILAVMAYIFYNFIGINLP